jgi:predicted esterase
VSEQTAIKTPHHARKTYASGVPLAEAKAAMMLIHGRGATAASILELARELGHADMAYLAPQADGNSWYPYSFLAPIEWNEPALSSGLLVMADVLAQVEAAGVPAERTVIGGFSQGACLAAEFVARNPRRYGGLFILSGGLIGPSGYSHAYSGSLDGTPVFLGCSDVDMHIPQERVHESAAVFERLGGQVTKRIYPSMGHIIIQDEIDHVGRIVDALFADHQPDML